MSYDDAKLSEMKAKLKARDDHIRESWVRAMELRLVSQALSECYKTEGVNHLENCKDLSERYINMLKENKVKGYKNVDI